MSLSSEISELADQMPTCPACGQAHFQHIFTKKGRHFWRCGGCSLERQFPLPTAQELTDYYESAYVEGMYKTFTAASSLKQMTAAHRFGTLKRHVRPGKWLDVGAADGVFVEYVRNHSIDAEGVEISRVAVDKAIERGLPLYCSTIEDFDPGCGYDTISGFDILEHVLDPASFLAALCRLLRPEGILVLAVPNQGSIYRMVMGQRWFHYIPEEHMFYFNPGCLERMLNAHGLEMIRWQRAFKAVSLNYSLTQFKEYNPLIYRLLSPFAAVLGNRLGDAPLAVYMGEMLVLARHSASS